MLVKLKLSRNTFVFAGGLGQTTKRGGGTGGTSFSGDGLFRASARSSTRDDTCRISEADRCFSPGDQNASSAGDRSEETFDSGLAEWVTENRDMDRANPRLVGSPLDTNACSLCMMSPTEYLRRSRPPLLLVVLLLLRAAGLSFRDGDDENRMLPRLLDRAMLFRDPGGGTRLLSVLDGGGANV